MKKDAHSSAATSSRTGAAQGDPSARILPWLLAGLVALVFGRSVGFEFTSYDDPVYVTANPHIADGLTVRAILWALGAGYAGNWHPVTWISHMADVEWFGLSPWGHHLTNVVLHGIATQLLFHILCRETKRPWLSFLATALFAIHPLRAESVAWVSERKDVLSACFALASVLLYSLFVEAKDGHRPDQPLGGNEGKEPRAPRVGDGGKHPRGSRSRFARYWMDARSRYAASLLLFALAIGSKPMFVTLPVLLILLDCWPLRRTVTPLAARAASTPRMSWIFARAWEKAPFFLLSALCAWITVRVQSGGGMMQAAATIPLLSRATNALVSHVWYLWKMLVPIDLSPLYLHPDVPGGKPWASWQILLAASVSIALTIAVWKQRARGYPLFGWLWYLIALLPVIGIVQVGGQAAADRYTYAPMIGICVAVVWAVADAVSRAGTRFHAPALRRATVAIAGASLLSYGALAWAQVGQWRDSETLYRHGLAVDPDNMLFHNNLGLILRARGDLDEAARHFEEALRIHPLYRQAMESLADIAMQRGRSEEAERYLVRALALKPGDGSGEQIDSGRVRILLHLGDLLAADRPDEAAAYYREAARMQPGLEQREVEQGRAMERAGRIDEARTHFERATRIDPANADAAYLLGTLLAEAGDFEGSAEHLRRVAQLDPARAEAHNDLGYVLLRAGRSREAVASLEKALELRPDWTLPAQTLAWILATDPDLRDPARAIALMEDALRAQGEDTGLLGTLAAAQAASGHPEAALTTVRRAIRLSTERNDGQTERLRRQEALYLNQLGASSP